MGTDYPYDMALPNAVKFVSSAKLARTDKAALLAGSAARLLKIKLPSPSTKAAIKSAPTKKRGAAKAKIKTEKKSARRRSMR